MSRYTLDHVETYVGYVHGRLCVCPSTACDVATEALLLPVLLYSRHQGRQR